MSADDLVKDPKAVEVSSPETHFQVQCEDVRLLSSLLQPHEKAEDDISASRFIFRIEAYIQGSTAVSHLHVHVITVNGEGAETGVGPDGYELRFTLLGFFAAEGDIPPKMLGDFVRMYTLSILWPYAREYTSEQLRRAGHPFESLPIINPQIVTEKLIEANLVQVEILTEDVASSDVASPPE